MLPQLRGAFCFVWMNEDTLYAARDPQGIRPLVLGRLDRGWVVASEDAALATIGASVVREVEPGEMVVIDENGLRSPPVRRAASPRAACSSTSTSPAPTPPSAAAACTRRGSRWVAELAREFPVEADLVMPVPESGTPAAAGYAEESGIPFGQGFVKNAYVGRTFIQPSQTLRQLGIRLKLNALEHMIRGKRIVVVDDSIVRGNTQRAQVRMLREAGALEVHVRISSPPVKWPCFYGIDFATRAELIANGLDVDEIAASVGADSLGYISLEGMVEATGQPAERLCRPASPASTRSRCPTRACSASTCSRRRSTSAGAARPQQPLIRRGPRDRPDRARIETAPTPPPASRSRPATRPSS